MTEMLSVVVFTVTGVDTSKIDHFKALFSERIGGREVKSHEKFGNLYFSAIAPKSNFTNGYWAYILASITGQHVNWETEQVMDW